MSKPSSNKIIYLITLPLHQNQELSKSPQSLTWPSFGLTFGTYKVAITPSFLSTDASMWGTTSPWWEVPTWIPEFPNARIAGNGATLLSHAISKEPNVLNAMALTSWSTIESLDGVVKPTTKLTHLGSKPRRANRAHIHSSAPIAKEITKLTPTLVHSGGTDSIGNGTSRNMLRSVKTDHNHSVLKQTVHSINDYSQTQNILTKRSQELAHHKRHPQNPFPLRHYLNPGTALVWNSKNSKLFKLWWWTSYRHLPSPQLDSVCKIPF